jgi:hypothetical protein
MSMNKIVLNRAGIQNWRVTADGQDAVNAMHRQGWGGAGAALGGRRS